MHETTLAVLKQNEAATVAALHGGSAFQHRLRSMGLKEGKVLHVVAKHPLSGPMVVEIERRQITIGRGMAHKIAVMRRS